MQSVHLGRAHPELSSARSTKAETSGRGMASSSCSFLEELGKAPHSPDRQKTC